MATSHETPFTGIAAQLAQGSQSAFRQLHEKYYTRLLYFAMQFSVPKNEAEDMVADAFLRLWEKRTQFQTEDHVRNFLYLTTRHRLLNLLDFKERQTGYLEHYGALQESTETPFSPQRLEAELLGLLHDGISTLPPECRKVFEFYLTDLPTSAIAKSLGITAATVRSQKRRAIQLLRLWIQENNFLLAFAHLLLFICN